MNKYLVLLLSGLGAVSAMFAQTSYSPPLGGLSYLINGGSTSVPVTTSFTIPLTDVPAASGSAVGRIGAVTSTTLTVTGANWTPGALATAQFPYVVRVTSGAARGFTFVITANTSDTLTISGGDPSQLGVITGVSGDTFALLPVDTLDTLFGSNTFLGAVSPAQADIVILSSSLQLAYYFNTTLNNWVRTTGPTTNRGNTPIPLESAISVVRKSSAFTLAFVGNVPAVRYALAVPNSGATHTHTGFPTDVSLASLSLNSLLPGWVSSATPNGADVLGVSNGPDFLFYYHNGTNWLRTTGPATVRDAIVIPAGTPIQIFKRGSAGGSSLFLRNPPFTL